jgi:glutathione synthase/RimK-type ligase-like ATP-grasp enzyme
MLIAIQPDNYGPQDAASPLWTRLLLEAGHNVKEVDVYSADILDQLKDCEAFMWRWAHFSGMGRIARRLLPVIENSLGIPIYPDQNTCWHYDDKIAQAYLFKAHAIPTPNTWLWFNPNQAREWAVSAKFPLVLKLASGAGSINVKLVTDFEDASIWIDRLFTQRLTSLDLSQFQSYGAKQRLGNAIKSLLQGDKPVYRDNGYDVQSGYVYFQEYLPDNEFDIRVTVIGNRAFGYRRFNRPNDFRASGSGNFDVNPKYIDKETVKLAFDVAQKLGVQSVAIDGLKKGCRPVVGEISYTYVSWMVQACPGHWDSDLIWHDGSMWPEEAQVQDFLERLKYLKLNNKKSNHER